MPYDSLATQIVSNQSQWNYTKEINQFNLWCAENRYNQEKS